MISTEFIIGMLNGPFVQFINLVVSAQYVKISFLRINEIRQLENEDELLSIGNTTILPEKIIYFNTLLILLINTGK